MPYTTIHTTYGLNALAAAQATGVPINLTHIAVGDGGGSDVTPTPAMTALVNERYRTTVNTVQQDPSNPTIYYVEMLIPAGTGGWTIREVGVFSDSGALFAVSNFPATYKSVPSDGATNDLAIRLELVVASAGLITLQIDPNVAIASRQWVLNNVNAATIIPGGTTGQVLTKSSNANGAYVWQSPSASTILVTTLEEQQTLASGQQTVNLVQRTTLGLSVFIEGVRLTRGAGTDQWQEGANNQQVILGKSYPAGTRATFLQNEPVGNLPTPLEKSLNLADVPDKALARANLGVPGLADIMPAGAVLPFARTTAPTGWIKANGAAVSRTTYAALFTAIGTTFGAGDGSTTFNLPDLRGEFVRGWDDGRGVDAGRVFGSWQADELRAHNHSYRWFPGEGNGEYDRDWQAGHSEQTGWTGWTGGAETRPRNVALLYCIKF